MQKREADFGKLFRHWVRANPLKITCHFELKQTQGDSLPFTSLEDHQVAYNEAIRDSPKGVLMRNVGMNGEPDYTYTYRDPVFVVVKYPACFCIISLGNFVAEKSTSKRKSLTVERAREIAQQVVELLDRNPLRKKLRLAAR